MQVYKVGLAELAIGPLASKLKSALYLGPTLWLVSGGSNIPVSVGVMERIDSELSANLTVALADERYGPYNHPDSNWQKLRDAGFDPKRARSVETIREDAPADLSATAARYAAELDMLFDNISSAIGQFGIGEDGHIAGILPGSPATSESAATAIGYAGQPFSRITISFAGIRRLNSAFVVAMGQTKLPQLKRLINQDLPLSEQPAQIIKQVGESYVYTDQIVGKQ